MVEKLPAIPERKATRVSVARRAFLGWFAFLASGAVLGLMAFTPRARGSSLQLTLTRNSLTNVDDGAGTWQFEGGQASDCQQQVANYASVKRVVSGGTDAQNTAMLTITIFFLGGNPPDNITLQGAHDFNSGDQSGSVSAASSQYLPLIGMPFSTHNGTLVIG